MVIHNLFFNDNASTTGDNLVLFLHLHEQSQHMMEPVDTPC